MNNESPDFSARLNLSSQAETEALGARLAAALRPGDLIALDGDLGAGKTTLARAILSALGVTEAMPSPTFTLVQRYDTSRLIVHHYDLYRIEDPRELDELGLEEALDQGALLVEWPERAAGRLPSDRLNLSLTMTGVHSRCADISGPARWASVFRD